MRVLLRIALSVVLHLVPEHIWQPWVIFVVRLDNNAIRRRVFASQEQINRISRFAWIPAKPQFTIRLANRWPEQVKAVLAKTLRFFYPCNVITLKRLHRVRCVVLHPLKDDQATVAAFDLRVLNLEVSPGVQRFDLPFKQFLYRLVKTSLNLTHANRVCLLKNGSLNQHLTKEMRLARASPSVCAFVSCWIEQRRKCPWRFNPSRR